MSYQGVECAADLSRKMVVAFSKEKIKGEKTIGLRFRVPFHIPYIRRPQDVYNIVVNNVNQPFDHVWLDKTEDGTAFIHPLVSCLLTFSFFNFFQFDRMVISYF